MTDLSNPIYSNNDAARKRSKTVPTVTENLRRQERHATCPLRRLAAQPMMFSTEPQCRARAVPADDSSAYGRVVIGIDRIGKVGHGQLLDIKHRESPLFFQVYNRP